MRRITSPDLGKRFKAIRDRLKFQQKDFASALDMSASYLSEIEKGRIKPGFDILSRLLRQFPVNPYYIFNGESPMMQSNKKEVKWKSEEDFGGLNPDVDKLFWYMRHSKLVRLDMLAHFERYLDECDNLIHKKLNRHGLSYPGEED